MDIHHTIVLINLEGDGLLGLNPLPHLISFYLYLEIADIRTMKSSSTQTNYGAVCINDGDANDVAATTEQEQPVLHESIENYYHDNSNSSDNKRHRVLTSILWLVVAFSIIAVVKELPVPSSNALRGGIQMEMLQAAQADASSEGSIIDPAADQPQPDYNGEGRYNWQKCKDSNDPNCWK